MNSENSELKRCPFCGSNAMAEFCDIYVTDVVGWYVQCTNRICRGNCNVITETKQEAVELWNRRYDIKDRLDKSGYQVFLCENCNLQFSGKGTDTMIECPYCGRRQRLEAVR